MAISLAAEVVRRPFAWRKIRALLKYRKIRECMADADARVEGFEQFSQNRAAVECGIDPDDFKETVEKWIRKKPLRFLARARYKGVLTFVKTLNDKGISICFFSDHPTEDKLRALGLEGFTSLCSIEVDGFKPNPLGLRVLMSRHGVSPEECLMIGDRDDRDGECARRAGVRYVIRGGTKKPSFSSYTDLLEALLNAQADGRA